jgi:hypothetical protein
VANVTVPGTDTNDREGGTAPKDQTFTPLLEAFFFIERPALGMKVALFNRVSSLEMNGGAAKRCNF